MPVLLILLVLAWLGHGLFRFLTFYPLSTYSSSRSNTEQPAVSVVICAKNEAENIRKNLPPVVNQNYPQFEVILVDDLSSDDTQVVAHEIAQTTDRLKVITTDPKFKERKGKTWRIEHRHSAVSI